MKKEKIYSIWFLMPAFVIFAVFFLIPVLSSFFYSLTIWDFKTFTFCGFDNYVMFFSEPSLNTSLIHTLVYAFMTSGLKVLFAFFIALFLTSKIRTKSFIRSAVFFPNLVSAIAVGITFSTLMHPTKGIINIIIKALGGSTFNFLGDPNIALFSVIAVDVWKGVSIATVIYIAGIQSIEIGRASCRERV